MSSSKRAARRRRAERRRKHGFYLFSITIRRPVVISYGQSQPGSPFAVFAGQGDK